ncbi:MAG: DUF3987 domain-containing protein [Eubacteriales bacterium]
MPKENNAKEKTALESSVGADVRAELSGQSSYVSDYSIPEIFTKINNEKINSQPFGRFDRLNDLPEKVKRDGHFCFWRYEETDGRKTKVPYNPISGHRAKSNETDSFVPFDMITSAPDYDGIGIGVFSPICAIDLDDCVTDSGTFKQPAADIIELMHSYTEYSPGGNGIHILFEAKDFVFDKEQFYIMNHKTGVEVYVAGATNKYVTVTGNRVNDCEYGDRSKELKEMLERFMRRDNFQTEKSSANAINAANSELDENELLRIIRSSKNGAEFNSLFSGNIGKYSSHSEADMALCSYLAFWTGKDAQKMDALFRKSGLMREKWDRTQSGSTYGAITIQKAIESCKEIYTHKQELAPQFSPLIPLTPQWSELPAFPMEALPDTIRNYAAAVAEHSQTSPDMAAVLGIGVLAVCLQGKFKVEGTPGYYEPLNLYTVVIASPGERKSGVMRAMTGVLYEYEQKFNNSRALEVRQNCQERESIERQISGLKKKLENKVEREMELELQYLEGQLSEMPELKPVRFFADDCSSEALTSLLANNGGILSVISAEGGIFDIMAGRYSSKINIDVWLKGHCGDPIYIDRMSRKSECIPHPTLSAILTIQPSVLTELMENTTMTGRGLIARFLYASPPSRIGSRVFRAPAVPAEISEAYRKMIFRLMSGSVDEETQTLRLSEKALEVVEEYFSEHEEYLAGEGQANADWASKYIGAVLRIAGLLHGADMEPGDYEISESTICRAIEIGKYFLVHSSYAYSMMGGDLNIKKAKFVMAKLSKLRKSEVKRSDLFQACRGKFFQKTEELLPTLDLLEEHGYIRQIIPERQGSGRPPDIRIFVNPEA